MILTDEQKKIIIENVPNGVDLIERDNLGDLLTEIDNVIVSAGMDLNYDLNDLGIKLQRIYDQIYNQN